MVGWQVVTLSEAPINFFTRFENAERFSFGRSKPAAAACPPKAGLTADERANVEPLAVALVPSAFGVGPAWNVQYRAVVSR